MTASEKRSERESGASSERDIRTNYAVYLASSSLSKLGDELSNPKTVLTWVLTTIGTPPAITAMLVPIRESGSMIPQVLLGAWVRRRATRKDLWILGSLLQAGAILGSAAAAAWFSPSHAGITILGCVILFSLARSLNSIVGKDVLGKTIPKGRRGRIGGWASGISGLLTLAVGLWFAVRGRGQDSPEFYAGLLAVAGSLWILASVVFAGLREAPGPTADDDSELRNFWKRLRIIRTDPPFRRFVLTRGFLLASALSAPFYVVLARQEGSGGASLLGTFLVAGGLASSVSSPAWGMLADRSSRRVLISAALLTAGLGITLFTLVTFRPDLAGGTGVFALFFFALGVAHAGVRSGRKTYIVDLAGGVKRTDYVSVSNSLIGVLLLGVGGVASAVSFLGPEWLILGFSILGLIGAGMATTLPEAE